MTADGSPPDRPDPGSVGGPVAPATGPGAAGSDSLTSRLRARQQRVVGKLEATRQSLEQRRPRSGVIDGAFRAFEHDVAAGGGVLAGAVAFRVFLFLVPYTFVLVVGFGFGADAKHKDAGDLARAAGISGLAAKAMASVGELSTSQQVLSLLVAAFALLLASRALLKVLRIVHALVWHTRNPKAGHVNRNALVLVLLVTVAVALAVLAGKLRGASFLAGILGNVLFIAIPIALWLVVTRYMPHPDDVPWTALLPGAVLFGFGVEVLHVVTVYWIAHQVDSKTSTYGAIGFALALLLWAYLVGRLVTSAAVVNEALWTRYRERQAQRGHGHR